MTVVHDYKRGVKPGVRHGALRRVKPGAERCPTRARTASPRAPAPPAAPRRPPMGGRGEADGSSHWPPPPHILWGGGGGGGVSVEVAAAAERGGTRCGLPACGAAPWGGGAGTGKPEPPPDRGIRCCRCRPEPGVSPTGSRSSSASGDAPRGVGCCVGRRGWVRGDPAPLGGSVTLGEMSRSGRGEAGGCVPQRLGCGVAFGWEERELRTHRCSAALLRGGNQLRCRTVLPAGRTWSNSWLSAGREGFQNGAAERGEERVSR